MNTSRIEVPLTLPPPHFDDEATIATARQVVPISGGRSFRRHRIVALLPLLIASMLCGAIGAVGVNYFQRRRDDASTVSQPPAPANLSIEAKTESPPLTVEPTPTAGQPETETSVQAAASAISSADDTSKKDKAQKIVNRPEPEPKSAPAAAKPEPAQDAAKLVRKRRVQPDVETPAKRNRRNDASRIEDLFTGPNP